VVTSLGLAALLTAPSPLPEGVELQWSGPQECPSAQEVHSRVAARLAEREGPVRASVVAALVEGEHGGYRLTLDVTLPDDTIHRELESGDCEVLVAATTVVVGIAVEPSIPAEQLETATLIQTPTVPPPVEPVPVQTQPTEPSPVTEETETVSVEHEAPQRKTPGGFIGLHGGGSAGVLPNITAVAGLRIGLRGEHWRVLLGGDRTFGTDESFPGDPDVGARFTMWSGTIRGCGVLGWRRLEFPLCGGVDAGGLRAAGFGGDLNHTPNVFWLGLAVSPGLVWAVHPNVGLGVSLDGLVSLRRPRFGESGNANLYEAFPVGARALAGFEFRWGD